MAKCDQLTSLPFKGLREEIRWEIVSQITCNVLGAMLNFTATTVRPTTR